MEAQKNLNSQNNLEKKEQRLKDHASWPQNIKQSCSNPNSMILAQKQTYRSMEQDREPRKLTYIWSIKL